MAKPLSDEQWLGLSGLLCDEDYDEQALLQIGIDLRSV